MWCVKSISSWKILVKCQAMLYVGKPLDAMMGRKGNQDCVSWVDQGNKGKRMQRA